MLSLTVGVVSAETSSVDSNLISLVEIGRRIYQEGIIESGEVLRGESAARVTFSGKQAACINCHRKSGLGTSEGKNIIRPITGEYLFPKVKSDVGADAVAPAQTILRQRALSQLGSSHAAYTQTTFAQALREGVDYTGHQLDRLMPRFVLSDKEVAALAAYLKTLSAHPDPGVDQSTLHFATVVMPGVEPRQSQAMLDVLNAYFTDKNSGTRSEGRRRIVGTEAMYRAYRQWKLHIWILTGPVESWRAQLEQRYRQQPVFAVLSGIGANWRPLHEFCEQREIPCLFPNSNLPVDDGGYYSFYLSRGMALEAEVLARHLSRVPGQKLLGENPVQSGTIMQIYRKDDSVGAEAAQLLRSNMQKTGDVVDIVDWTFSSNLVVESWQQMLADKHPQTLVMWVGEEDLARLGSWDVKGYSPQQIYLSASMLGGDLAGDAGLLGKHLDKSLDSIRLIYPFELPKRAARHLQRTKLWLRAKNIALTDERVQANTYFVATVAGDSITHLFHNFSRDYFIERVEHMVNRSLVTSVYPRLSLGPGQRFASKGAYLVRYSSHPNKPVELVADWIVP